MKVKKFGKVLKTQILAFIFVILAIVCMVGVGSAVVYHGNEVIDTDTTWSADVHVINASCSVHVNEGATLTISPGAVVKFGQNDYYTMRVYGKLKAIGTSGNKIVFTSLKDDSYGGDTNGDGFATSPAPGDWGFIYFRSNTGYYGIGIFDHCIVRYGGGSPAYHANIYSGYSALFSFKNSVCEYSQGRGIDSRSSQVIIINSVFKNNGDHGLSAGAHWDAPVTISNSAFKNNGNHGLYSGGGILSVTNNTFTGNTNYAAYLSGITITSFQGNTGSGNGKNAWGIGGTVSTSQTWDALLPYAITGSLLVDYDKTLTLEPGVVMKFESADADMCVRGTLNATGTAANKIAFTSLKDDSYGGDTNNDGSATSPAPGDWESISVNLPDGIGIFDHCIVRYGGSYTTYPANVYIRSSSPFSFKNSICEYSERTGIYSYSSSLLIINSTIKNNGNHGLYSTGGNTLTVTNNTFKNNSNHGLYSSGGTISVTDNIFTDNTNYATYISGATITSFRANTGCGNGKNAWGIGGTVPTSQTWDALLPYVIIGGLTINDNRELTLEPGVVVKFESTNAKMTVVGTLNASGTPDNKIVFTSLKDDFYGGDTNNDGDATSPAPGDWKYILLWDGVGIFNHSIVRYGGSDATYPANIYGSWSDSFLFKNSVCEYSQRNGIYRYSTNGGSIISSTITDNNQYGIRLHSSDNNLIYNNYFNNTNNAYDNGNNIWNTTKTAGTNIIGGPYLGGNYWSDYNGNDTDEDGIGDTDLPYNTGITIGGDWLPLTPTNVSVETSTGGTATFSTDSGQFADINGVDEDSLPQEAIDNKPGGLTLPHGLFNFTITGLTPGQSVNLTITLPSPVPVGSLWWKVNTTAGNNTWYSLPIGDDNGDNVVTITLTDGGLGDIDGAANGVIVDPSGIGEVALPDLVITEKWVNWPDNCTICYNVKNIGNGTALAGHNTTLFVDGVEEVHDPVPEELPPGENYTGCFDDYIWTYTPPEDNITVCADNNNTVEESNEANNCAINTWMCGDVNEDGTVNVLDVLGVYRRALDPGYVLELPWAADVNCDGNINVLDVLGVYRRALDPNYDLNCCCE